MNLAGALVTLPRDSLVLAPVDPFFAPDTPTLISGLQAAGFIGERHEKNTFFVGKDFARLLVFMGCAPRLVTEPDEHDHWLRVDIPSPSHSPRLYAGKNTRTPRCPTCKAPLDGWREAFSQATEMNCPACNEALRAAVLQVVGVSCAPIIVSPIFDGEAVPGAALEAVLLELTESAYRYAYISGKGR